MTIPMRLLSIAALLLALLLPAVAQQGGPVVAGQARAEPSQQTAGPPVVLVAPAQPPGAVVDTGSIAGQALVWVVTTFGGVIGIVLTRYLNKLAQKAHVDLTDAQRARLQEIVVNGLHAGAAAAQERLQGKGAVDVKNATVAEAIRYVQAHGKDTLEALGRDPLAQGTVEVIKARIEAAIADPTVATPKVLDAVPPPAEAAKA